MCEMEATTDPRNPHDQVFPRAPAPRRTGFFQRNKIAIFAVGGILAVHLAFISLNRRSFSYDDAWYADTAIRFLDVWSAGHLPEAYDFFVNDTFLGIKAVAKKPPTARYDLTFRYACISQGLRCIGFGGR